ncbi:MAG: hypothetical protein DHS20C10_09270 [marine bacterium B5-7]|nr:MAG: hypothetical protein DHS20C10_09270 [marine bacterium B5-7]
MNDTGNEFNQNTLAELVQTYGILQVAASGASPGVTLHEYSSLTRQRIQPTPPNPVKPLTALRAHTSYKGQYTSRNSQLTAAYQPVKKVLTPTTPAERSFLEQLSAPLSKLLKRVISYKSAENPVKQDATLSSLRASLWQTKSDNTGVKISLTPKDNAQAYHAFLMNAMNHLCEVLHLLNPVWFSTAGETINGKKQPNGYMLIIPNLAALNDQTTLEKILAFIQNDASFVSCERSTSIHFKRRLPLPNIPPQTGVSAETHQKMLLTATEEAARPTLERMPILTPEKVKTQARTQASTQASIVPSESARTAGTTIVTLGMRSKLTLLEDFAKKHAQYMSGTMAAMIPDNLRHPALTAKLQTFYSLTPGDSDELIRKETLIMTYDSKQLAHLISTHAALAENALLLLPMTLREQIQNAELLPASKGHLFGQLEITHINGETTQIDFHPFWRAVPEAIQVNAQGEETFITLDCARGLTAKDHILEHAPKPLSDQLSEWLSQQAAARLSPGFVW